MHTTCSSLLRSAQPAESHWCLGRPSRTTECICSVLSTQFQVLHTPSKGMHIEVRDVWQLQRLPTQPTYFERATQQGKDGKGGRGGSSLCKEDTSALGKQFLPAKDKHLDRKDSPTFSLHAQSPFQAHRPAALWRQPWHFAYSESMSTGTKSTSLCLPLSEGQHRKVHTPYIQNWWLKREPLQRIHPQSNNVKGKEIPWCCA